MIALDPPFRPATPADAPALADLVDIASEGIAGYLWTQMAGPGENPWEIGRARQAEKVETAEIVVADEGEGVLAALTGYAIPARPEPVGSATRPLLRPLAELEALAPRSWYVNVLATYPEARGRGFGSRLLTIAEALARAGGLSETSIIVADSNAPARRLYRRAGYAERATRPIVREGWRGAGTDWLLLAKPLGP